MKKWLIPSILCVLAIVFLFRPAWNITFDQSISENRILFQYEMFGCGSIVGKVLDGGAEITADYIQEYPEIGMDEVVFTEESDEPRKHLNPVNFETAGLAEQYTYIIEGTPVGVTSGAPDCCEPKPAYHETVVEFQVENWYFTSYVPYVCVGNEFVIMFVAAVLLVAVVWLLKAVWKSRSNRN